MVGCMIEDLKEVTVECKICGSKYHGVCLQAPRGWYSTFLSKHFICSDCTVQHKRCKNAIGDFNEDLKQLNKICTDRIASNTKSFEELSHNLDSINLRLPELLNDQNRIKDIISKEVRGCKIELISAIQDAVKESENGLLQKLTALSDFLQEKTRFNEVDHQQFYIQHGNILDELEVIKKQLDSINLNIKFNSVNAINDGISAALDSHRPISLLDELSNPLNSSVQIIKNKSSPKKNKDAKRQPLVSSHSTSLPDINESV